MPVPAVSSVRRQTTVGEGRGCDYHEYRSRGWTVWGTAPQHPLKLQDPYGYLGEWYRPSHTPSHHALAFLPRPKTTVNATNNQEYSRQRTRSTAPQGSSDIGGRYSPDLPVLNDAAERIAPRLAAKTLDRLAGPGFTCFTVQAQLKRQHFYATACSL